MRPSSTRCRIRALVAVEREALCMKNYIVEVLASIGDGVKSVLDVLKSIENQMRTISSRLRVIQEKLESMEALRRGEYGLRSGEQDLGEGRRQRCGCPLVAHVERYPESMRVNAAER